MSKWNVVLSTTEPYNYVGMIQVRQGNKNTEVMEATIVENGLPTIYQNVRYILNQL